ncbi:hypothetical protein GCM10007276_26240 [Agaricicola taiwanensis]|uniref:Divalent-cation tolerance protein CutA n=1 Tax=Agaricicola taiwanensis TaxID=591372 RepID=A0A8J2YJT7_9RHOB|nr:divalent-cation tolerance protein CutA [Agaricicola taiwanensis]GGE47752.1 hypothetical protein GCM10007276_26240 [Agaricicola taiwanensis]
MDSPVLVYTTWPKMETAAGAGQALVERKLAACVNIMPEMVSIFPWRGRVEEVREVVMIIKTRQDRLEETMSAVAEMHPYDTPAVLALPLMAVHPGYAKWIVEETTEA